MIPGLRIWSAVLFLVVAPAGAQDDPQFSFFGSGVALVKTPVPVPARELPTAFATLSLAPSLFEIGPTPMVPPIEVSCNVVVERVEKPVKRVGGRVKAFLGFGCDSTPTAVIEVIAGTGVVEKRWRTDRAGKSTVELIFEADLASACEPDAELDRAVVFIEAQARNRKRLSALTLDCVAGDNGC